MAIEEGKKRAERNPLSFFFSPTPFVRRGGREKKKKRRWGARGGDLAQP